MQLKSAPALSPVVQAEGVSPHHSSAAGTEESWPSASISVGFISKMRHLRFVRATWLSLSGDALRGARVPRAPVI